MKYRIKHKFWGMYTTVNDLNQYLYSIDLQSLKFVDCLPIYE